MGKPLKLGYLFLFAAGYLCLHALCILAFPAHAGAASFPFEVLAPSLATAACFWRARGSGGRSRLLWTLASISLFLWACAMAMSVWEVVFQRESNMIAQFSDFIFFVYGIPMLVVMSLPTDSEWVPEFLWLDGVQTVMTACIAYVAIFHVTPFAQIKSEPISASLLSLTFDIENLVLALGATLRLMAHSRGRPERRVYLALCSFLWVYAIATGVYNHLFLVFQSDAGILDLLTDVPFLSLALAAMLVGSGRGTSLDEPIVFRKRPFAIFIDNASPVFFTLALLAMGIYNVRRHFSVGIAAIVVAFVVYALRSTLLQGRYMRSQEFLQEARDRLEEMSLQDGLTGVANRRCFDQMLALEWNRATRMQHPLSLLMIDVDYFKNLNDTYGHRIGDECLTLVASALKCALPRSGDLLARYGGEEFVAILADTSRHGAEVVAERMKDAVRSLNIQNETSIGRFATVSIGIAVCEAAQRGSPEFLVEASDRALYQAKQNGRNRVEVASMQPLFDVAHGA